MKGTTIKLGISKHTSAFFRNNAVTLIFTMICVGGYAAGVLAASRGSDNVTLYSILTDYFVNIRVNGGYYTVFLNSLLSVLLFVIMAFVSGLSLAGIPFLPVISFLKGFFCGVISGSVVSGNSFKGIAFIAAVMAVPTLISCSATVLSCKEACGFSSYMLKSFSNGTGTGFAYDFKVYGLRYLVFLGICVVSSVADMLLSVFFAGLFGIV